MGILGIQFKLSMGRDLPITETDGMSIDEFDLFINLYNEHLKELDRERGNV